jgi:dienelactone hydrolase
MRPLLAVLLFSGVCFLIVNLDAAGQQPEAKKAQQNFDPPVAIKPNEATLKQIAQKTEQLRKSIEGLKAKKIAIDVRIDVEIYLKAAENIVRFEEWYSENSGNWALQTLDQGLERAKQAEGGQAVWWDSPGRWVVGAYPSRIDGSIQPFAVLLPYDYGKDPKKKWRLDIVLHGRDAALTEAKFISSHGTTTKAAPKDLDYIQLEVYGRGNNAYRWAGERDVDEAVEWFSTRGAKPARDSINFEKVVLRGFSMGGAGTWHIGLHHPFAFAVIGPGAGFTSTHGYVGNLPKVLPDYQEKCLRIYDAFNYADNAFNVPIVAYSGANDPQKAAADNIENALKGFKEPLRFTHLVAPGLEHQMPKEWQDKAEAEYKKYLDKGRKFPEHVRFVTYTTHYNDFGHGFIESLEHHYEKAVVNSHWNKDGLTISTENIRILRLFSADEEHSLPKTITIDGQSVETVERVLFYEKRDGKWAAANTALWRDKLQKLGSSDEHHLQGPIDDAFTTKFKIVPSSGNGWYPSLTKYMTGAHERFAYEWDKYFRGKLRSYTVEEIQREKPLIDNLVLFGDPESNPLIAEVLPKLPITWTKEKLIVNGVEYDSKTHIPVMIYPNPLRPYHYVVLNSGHTFHEADFKGTNALLYPRLGDWAVLKPTPTEKDPAPCEVVAAGLFDENWQFPKKK